jgi:hypothetical protein
MDAQGTPAMTEFGAGTSRTARCRSLRELWILLGTLIALWMVHLVVSLKPGFLARDEDDGLPLDRCLTEQAVLQFLDGKAVFSLVSVDAAGRVVEAISRLPDGVAHLAAAVQDAPGRGGETIILRKKKISSLRIRSDYGRSILVRFNLDHQGKQYLVEGTFQFTTSDSPELHWHGWDDFLGVIVSSR